MKKQRPKIKYFIPKYSILKKATRFAKLLANADIPNQLPKNPKNGEYNLLIGDKWHSFIFFDFDWYYCREVTFDYSYIEKLGLLPNISEKEWDAIKIAGHKRLNKYWQKMLQARLHQDWCRSFKLSQFKRRKSK